VVRNEYAGEAPNLHLYIQPRPGSNASVEEVRKIVSGRLRERVQEYSDFEGILGKDPLRVTYLPLGAFDGYMEAQQEAGADLAHLRPPQMQPSDSIMERLLQA
jgi:hypothetical protein